MNSLGKTTTLFNVGGQVKEGWWCHNHSLLSWNTALGHPSSMFLGLETMGFMPAVPLVPQLQKVGLFVIHYPMT